MAFYFWPETEKTREKQRALALPASGSDLWNAAGAAENSSAGHVAIRLVLFIVQGSIRFIASNFEDYNVLFRKNKIAASVRCAFFGRHISRTGPFFVRNVSDEEVVMEGMIDALVRSGIKFFFVLGVLDRQTSF